MVWSVLALLQMVNLQLMLTNSKAHHNVPVTICHSRNIQTHLRKTILKALGLWWGIWLLELALDTPDTCSTYQKNIKKCGTIMFRLLA